MNRKRRLKIEDFNPHLICVLCGGYFIDATTIIECLHSFCRPCIVHYLETNRFCPICDVQVHKSKPLQNIRPDRTLQDLVYKLVPGLYQSEMKSRKEFYKSHPECPPRDIILDESLVYTPDECFSLTLEYYQECNHPYMKYPARMKLGPVTGDEDSRTEESRGDGAISNVDASGNLSHTKSKPDEETSPCRNIAEPSRRNPDLSHESGSTESVHVPCKPQVDSPCDTRLQSASRTEEDHPCNHQLGQGLYGLNKEPSVKEETCSIKKRYLRCPAAVTITHLQKLIRAKYDLDCNHPVEILHRDEPLSDHLTLIDVAYIYKWKRKGPLNLYFRLFDITNDQHCNQHVLNTQACKSAVKVECKGIVEKVNKKNEIDDWKEVQLQISETGIMSVAGVSLEHNNNLTSTNNNLLNNATGKDSEPSGGVKTGSDKVDPKSPLSENDVTNSKESAPENKFVSPVHSKMSERTPILSSQSKQSSIAVNLTSKQETSLAIDRDLRDQSVNPVKVKTETVYKKGDVATGDTKINNVGSEKRKNTTPMKIQESCANTPKRTKLSPTKHCESLDLSVKPVKKENASNTPSEISNTNDSEGYKPIMKQVPPNLGSGVDLDTKPPFPSDYDSNLKDKNHTASTGITTAPAIIHSKKSPNSSSMGYKTLKVPPKTWNPSITRSSYLISKASPNSNMNSNSTVSPVKTPEKVPKFFKMRNMPRYLGNPASGVKPMYQVASDSKTQEPSDSISKSKQVVMKLDPKTLCPIPVASSTSVTSSPAKPFYTTATTPDSGSNVADAPKTSPRHKNNSHSRKNQASIPSPNMTNSLPPVSFSHSARTGSPFANSPLTNAVLTNAALTNAALSAHSPPATTSNNILLNPTNYAINPATLNLLSSNLSFLPNASNFLYGNYSNFAPPLIRPNLSMTGPGSGLPSALPLGAFHSMPPSINMLFPHHRTNSGGGFTSSTKRAQTPAIQRIPASKGGGNNTSSSYKTAKSANLPSPKNNQTSATQKPVNNHTQVKTNSSTNPFNINEKASRDMSVCKKNSIHKEETSNSTRPTNSRSEVNSSNNNNNNAAISKSENVTCSDLISFNKEEVNPPLVDAPAPVTHVENCDATKEASPATDSIGQSEPEDSSLKVGLETALDKNVLPSSELDTTHASFTHTDIVKVPELNNKNSDIDCSSEQSLGATVDGCSNSKFSMTIESKEKVVK